MRPLDERRAIPGKGTDPHRTRASYGTGWVEGAQGQTPYSLLKFGIVHETSFVPAVYPTSGGGGTTAYRFVKGGFQLLYYSTRRVGSPPDGDSLWFKPDDSSLLVNIERETEKLGIG